MAAKGRKAAMRSSSPERQVTTQKADWHAVSFMVCAVVAAARAARLAPYPLWGPAALTGLLNMSAGLQVRDTHANPKPMLETPRSPSHLPRCLTLENYRKIA